MEVSPWINSGGSRGGSPPLFLDQTPRKLFLRPPPPLSQGRDDQAPLIWRSGSTTDLISYPDLTLAVGDLGTRLPLIKTVKGPSSFLPLENRETVKNVVFPIASESYSPAPKPPTPPQKSCWMVTSLPGPSTSTVMLTGTTLKQTSTVGLCCFSVGLMKLGSLYMRPRRDSDFELRTSDIRHIRHRIPLDITHDRTSEIERQPSDIGPWTSDIGHWTSLYTQSGLSAY